MVVGDVTVVVVSYGVTSPEIAKFRARCRQRRLLSFSFPSRKIRLWWLYGLHYLSNVNAVKQNKLH